MDIKSLREEYAQIDSELDKLITKANSDEGLTAEETEKQDKLFARGEQIKKTADNISRRAALKFATEDVVSAEPKGKVEFDNARKPVEFSRENWIKGVTEFMATGRVRDEYAIISTSGSSVLIPKEVLDPAVVLTPYNSYLAAGVRVINTPNTGKISIPLWDDSGNIGATLTESNTSETTPVDSTPSELDLSGTLKESKSRWISNTAILENNFDLVSLAVNDAQIALSRAQHSQFDTYVKTLTTGMTTNAANSASAVTYADVLTWEHSVPVAYRQNLTDLAMIVSDTFYKLLRGLVDSQNRPIMDTDPQNGFQKSIHGIPVYVSEYMSTIAASAKVGALVNKSRVFARFVVPARLAVYRDVPSYPDKTGVNLFQESGIAADPSAVRLFRMGTS